MPDLGPVASLTSESDDHGLWKVSDIGGGSTVSITEQLDRVITERLQRSTEQWHSLPRLWDLCPHQKGTCGSNDSDCSVSFIVSRWIGE